MRKAQVLAINPAVYPATYRIFATTDFGLWLHELGMPTLVITGEHDPGCGPVPNRKIAEALPRAELVILDNLRHSILVEAPQRVAPQLLRFLLAASSDWSGSNLRT